MSLGLTSLGFIGLPLASEAIVIRDDVPDEHYHASVADFPPLVTLYNIGVHGTLIHPNWFVTAAHAVFCMNPGQQVLVGQQVATVEWSLQSSRLHTRRQTRSGVNQTA